MSDEIQPTFPRRPYVVSYIKDGEKKTIRRFPPPLLHEMLPTDIVELTESKNADFKKGDRFQVKHVNPRHPNTLQIEDDEGIATFVPYFDLLLKESRGRRNGQTKADIQDENQYLMWP